MTPTMTTTLGRALRMLALLPALLGLRPAQALMPPDEIERQRLQASGELAAQSLQASASSRRPSRWAHARRASKGARRGSSAVWRVRPRAAGGGDGSPSSRGR